MARIERHSPEEIAAIFEGTDEVVVHSLRDALKFFDVNAADTIRQWVLAGKLAGEQAPEPNGRWTIRITKDHPLLIGNRTDDEPPHHYPMLEDQRDIEIARLSAERERFIDEIQFLRGQVTALQQQQMTMFDTVVGSNRKALPDPNARPWWWWLWPWARP